MRVLPVFKGIRAEVKAEFDASVSVKMKPRIPAGLKVLSQKPASAPRSMTAPG